MIFLYGGGLSADLAKLYLKWSANGFVAVTCLTALTERALKSFRLTMPFFNMNWIAYVMSSLQDSDWPSSYCQCG